MIVAFEVTSFICVFQIDNGAPAEEVAQIIEGNTESEDLFGGDLVETTDMMTRVVDSVSKQTKNQTQEKKVKVVKEVGKAIVQSGSNLLSRKQENSWKDLPQEDQHRVGTLLVIAMEKNANQVADMITKPSVVSDVQENIGKINQWSASNITTCPLASCKGIRQNWYSVAATG